MSGGPYREVADAPLPVDPYLKAAEACERAARALTEAVVQMITVSGDRVNQKFPSTYARMDRVVGNLLNFAAVQRAIIYQGKGTTTP
jgi:hypothetical protein